MSLTRCNMEKLLSAVHVVTGMVKYIRKHLSISENNSLATGTLIKTSAIVLTLVSSDHFSNSVHIRIFARCYNTRHYLYHLELD